MEINPIHPLQSGHSAATTALPDLKLVDEFTQTLSRQPTTAVNPNFVPHLPPPPQPSEPLSAPPLAVANPTLLTDPVQTLGIQAALYRSVVEVDLAAKIAGSMSQSINKLVNMQ